MTKCTVLVGIPGSGKSTYCKTLSENTIIISTDRIREELFGDESIQKNPKLVFDTAYNRIQEAISAGKDVVFDATNIYQKDRLKFLNTFKTNSGCTFILVIMNCPLVTALIRNKERARHVPEEVIERMHKELFKYDISDYLDEGWDIVREVYAE